VPSVSEAAEPPHYFANGARRGEGTRLPMLFWGSLSLTSEDTGSLECRDSATGYIENPKAAEDQPKGAEGPAGVGAIESFQSWEVLERNMSGTGLRDDERRNINVPVF
jgi:hypothetical protein